MNSKLKNLRILCHEVRRPILQESLTNPNDDELRNAIETIKSAFGERKTDAMEFKKFLESLNEKQRLNSYVVKRGWEKWQSDAKKHT